MGSKLKCFHCGNNYKKNSINFNDRLFCSGECQSVYRLLSKNNLITYYGISEFPGLSPKRMNENYINFNDSEAIEELYDFTDKEIRIITLKIPQMHCNSCVWLLENLGKLKEAIIVSQVDLLKKEVRIVFNDANFKLKKLIELLCSIGYEPFLKLETKSLLRDKIYNFYTHDLKIIGLETTSFTLVSIGYILIVFSFIGMFTWYVLTI